jgi:hypothetical protein
MENNNHMNSCNVKLTNNNGVIISSSSKFVFSMSNWMSVDLCITRPWELWPSTITCWGPCFRVGWRSWQTLKDGFLLVKNFGHIKFLSCCTHKHCMYICGLVHVGSKSNCVTELAGSTSYVKFSTCSAVQEWLDCYWYVFSVFLLSYLLCWTWTF